MSSAYGIKLWFPHMSHPSSRLRSYRLCCHGHCIVIDKHKSPPALATMSSALPGSIFRFKSYSGVILAKQARKWKQKYLVRKGGVQPIAVFVDILDEDFQAHVKRLVWSH